MQRQGTFAVACAAVVAVLIAGYYRLENNSLQNQLSADGQSADVMLDDSSDQTGEGIDWKSPRGATVDGLPLPVGPFLLSDLQTDSPQKSYESTDQMVQAAFDGDNFAAFSIFSSAQQCMDQNLLLSSIESMGSSAPSSMTDDLLTLYDERAVNCKVFPSELIDRRIEFLRLAASRGDIRAQINFLGGAPSPEDVYRQPEKLIAFKQEALQYLRSAVSSGSLDAMIVLAHQYHDGMYSDDPDSKVMALALMIVADESGAVHGTSEVHDLWLEGMAEDEIEQSRRLARRMQEICC